MFENKEFRAANNRAYYAAFHSLRSVLALDNYDSQKNSGIISEFRKRYIKEGIFSKKISRMIGDAFLIRNASDYDDMFIADRKQTEIQIANAENIISKIENYLKKLGIL